MGFRSRTDNPQSAAAEPVQESHLTRLNKNGKYAAIDFKKLIGGYAGVTGPRVFSERLADHFEDPVANPLTLPGADLPNPAADFEGRATTFVDIHPPRVGGWIDIQDALLDKPNCRINPSCGIM